MPQPITAPVSTSLEGSSVANAARSTSEAKALFDASITLASGELFRAMLKTQVMTTPSVTRRRKYSRTARGVAQPMLAPYSVRDSGACHPAYSGAGIPAAAGSYCQLSRHERFARIL